MPIVIPLWITLPDVRKTVCCTGFWKQNLISLIWLYNNPLIILFNFQSSKKFFPVTFLGSICWIAVFSYLMVWWAHQVHKHLTLLLRQEVWFRFLIQQYSQKNLLFPILDIWWNFINHWLRHNNSCLTQNKKIVFLPQSSHEKQSKYVLFFFYSYCRLERLLGLRKRLWAWLF